MTTATTTFFSVTPALTVNAGDYVHLTAQVAGGTPGVTPAPSGTVDFKDSGSVTVGSVTLTMFEGSGVGTFSTTSLAVGSHILTAQYNGDVNYDPSIGGPITVVVHVVAPSPPPPGHGHGHGPKH